MLKKYILVLTIILAVLTVFCGCTQIKSAELEPGTTFYNTENIYTNGLFNPTPLYTKWVIEENGITIKTEYEEKTMEPISRGWQELPFSNEEWNAFFDIPEEAVDISPYGKILYQTINDFNFMLLVNGKIWRVSLFPYGPEEKPWKIKEINLLVPDDIAGSEK